MNNQMRLTDTGDELDVMLNSAIKEFSIAGPQIAIWCSAIASAVSNKLRPIALATGLLVDQMISGLNFMLRKLGSLKAVVDTERGGFQTNASAIKIFENNKSKNIVAKIFTKTIDQQYLENSQDVSQKNLVKSLSSLRGQLSADGITEYIDVDLLEFRLQRGEALIDNPAKLSVVVLGTNAIKSSISNFAKSSFDLAFSNEGPAATFDYVISYLYGGKPVTETITPFRFA